MGGLFTGVAEVLQQCKILVLSYQYTVFVLSKKYIAQIR